MADWIGRTLGRVRIESLVARGGMAEVYLGTHTTLQREVAVKLLRNIFDDDPRPRERFEREAQAVAKLRHPNIVQVFDFDTIDGQRSNIADVAPEQPSPNMLRAIREDGFLSLFEQTFTLDPSLAFGNKARRTLSQMFVPVRSGERIVGVLSIQSYQLRAYTDKSLATLKSLASHCAGALARVWAQEALGQMVERLKALYKAAHAVSASLDMDQLYDAIHSTVEAVMPCNDFVIDGYAPETNEIVPLYAIEHPRKRVRTERYTADHGMAGKIVHTGISILLNSTEDMDRSGIDFELYGSSPTDLTQSIVAVPLVLHGIVTGMISAPSATISATRSRLIQSGM